MRQELGPMQALWNGTVIADSDETVLVEGNCYFPVESVRPGVLTGSKTRSLCPWKGLAGYYDVTTRGSVNHDAAWTYRHPTPFARRIKGKVAFWQGVQVGPAPRGVHVSQADHPGRNA